MITFRRAKERGHANHGWLDSYHTFSFEDHSSTNPVHVLQIWLEPYQAGVDPGYYQRYFAPEDRHGRIVVLVSPDGRDGSIRAHQDALLFGTFLRAEDRLSHVFTAGRSAHVQVARGSARVNDDFLEEGDGTTIVDASVVKLDGAGSAELLLFDLP